MATLNDKYVVVGQPDGFTDQNVVRSRVFKNTVDDLGGESEGDTLDTAVNYAVAKFPAGFIPRSVVANVIDANGTAATVTVSMAKAVTDLEKVTVTAANSSASTFAAGTKGQTLIDVETPFVTGENDYLVLTASAAVDAKFEVVCIGDWPELAGVPHLPKVV